MFFDDWTGIVRVLLVGSLAYAGLVTMLRISGKRTLSKMNAFDLVVTVALGSTLATVLLGGDDVPLAEGLAALGLLCLLQYVVAFASVRSPGFQRVIKSEPQLLYHRGSFMTAALRNERVTVEEVLAAVRGSGIGSMEEVAAVVLETDGTFSIVRPGPSPGPSPGSSEDALRTVQR